MRKLIVSFGPNGQDLGHISAVSEASWKEFATLLTDKPLETNDKTSRGWFIPAEFSPRRRHSDNFIARHALTLDYDVVTPEQVKQILASLAAFEYVVYTTWSHSPEKPRVRIVMPTTRPMAADEFCCVSRTIAALSDIEYAARESHTPCQMAFQPTKKAGVDFKARLHSGTWTDPDLILAQYEDWTDPKQWPHRREHDEQYRKEDLLPPPTSKGGVIGAFCRAFFVPEAIDRFSLPYKRVD